MAHKEHAKQNFTYEYHGGYRPMWTSMLRQKSAVIGKQLK